jgi:hypothetical protein
MQKTLLAGYIITILFNITASYSRFLETGLNKRFVRDELSKAASVLLISIEENPLNHDTIKMGLNTGLLADADMLFSEYNGFIRNCRYIRKEGVKLKILMFNGIISYFDKDDNEIYIEPAGGEDESAVKIKRQLLKIFDSNDFEIRKSLFDGLSDNMLILIYENKANSIGYNSDTDLSYEYAKTRVR